MENVTVRLERVPLAWEFQRVKYNRTKQKTTAGLDDNPIETNQQTGGNLSRELAVTTDCPSHTV